MLSQYSPAFLDQISAVLLAVTVVSYLMYSLTFDTALKVGSEALSKDLGSPTETVFNDKPLVATMAL